MIPASDVQLISYSEVSSTLVTLNDINSSVSLRQQQLYFDNGLSFNINSLCTNIKDVSINNNSILMLADSMPLTAVYTDTSTSTTHRYEDILKHSVLRIEYGIIENINTVYDVGVNTNSITNINNKSKYLNINDHTISLEDKPQQLMFIFADNKVSILNEKQYCLTDRGTFFISSKFSNLDNQKFYYIINNKNLFLFKDQDRNHVIVFDCITGTISSKVLTFGETLTDISTLFIEFFETLKLKPSSIQNSFITKYKNSPISAKNSLDIDNFTKALNYDCQYLINIPYKNKDNIVYVNSLKNYQTPEYEYAIRNNQEHRYYTNIFTGNNQSTGHSNIFLNYISNTHTKTLEKDKETYFYYPATSLLDCIPLSSSGLIEDGAVAGKNPYTSDRIKFNYKDYRELNIPSISSIAIDNRWLFSWLSAGEDKSQWIDRFYIGDSDIKTGPELEGDITREKILLIEPVPPGIGELAQPNTTYNFNRIGVYRYRITILPGDTLQCTFNIGSVPDKISILDSSFNQIATTGWIGDPSYQPQLPEPLTSTKTSAVITVKNESKNIPYMYIKVEQCIEGSWCSMNFNIIPGPRPELPPSPKPITRTKTVSGWMVDIPSAMCLSPGRLYSYFHQGYNNINNYIKTFDQIHRDNTTNLLYVNKWDKLNISDRSIHKNDGIYILNQAPLSADQIYLDGKSYVLFPATSSLQENNQLTVGAWVKVEDWNNINGYQIFGNYAEGGIGLFNKQMIHTAIFTLYDEVNSYIYNYNTDINIVSECDIASTSKGSVYIQRLMDQQYWIININTFILTKYDLNNNKILEIDISKYVSSITQVELDENENLYIIDRLASKIHKINNKTGNLMFNYQGIRLPAGYSRVEILKKLTHSDLIFNDGDVAIVGVNGDKSTSDSTGNIWASLGSNVYKNKQFYACVGVINQIICDSSDNIWILHNFNTITKIDTANDNFAFTLKLNNKEQQNIYINFIRSDVLGDSQDVLVAISKEEGTLYMVSESGSIILENSLYLKPSIFSSKQNYKNTLAYTAAGDFTGYQYQRKFNKSSAVEWKISITDTIEKDTKKTDQISKLIIPTIHFDEGWHYFALVFDHIQGKIISYVDGEEISKITFEPFKYLIKTSSKPFCIGAATTVQGILNDSIGINDIYKFVGYVSNIHIYKYAFDKYDIKNLYRGTYLDMFKNLVWNINIGSRNYIEEIEQFFMNKMPGSKSKFFNIKIHNFDATNQQRDIVEDAIRKAIKRIAPADTTLKDILWV